MFTGFVAIFIFPTVKDGIVPHFFQNVKFKNFSFIFLPLMTDPDYQNNS